MARPYRIQGENCVYHITSRGDGRKPIFHKDQDYLKFLEYLKKSKDKFKFYLYAYCLMPNHYHLFIETTLANLSRVMHYINTSYTVYHNVKYSKCGHLFQGRYKSILVEADSYFLELSRYIHLNPVRARIVSKPGDYKWSSYDEYMGKAGFSMVDKEKLSRYLKISRQEYEKFTLDGIGLEGSPLDSVYAGFMLGSEKFIKDTIADLKIDIENKDFSHKKNIQSHDPKEIISSVEGYYHIERDTLRRSFNKPSLAKKVAIYLLKTLTAMSNKEIGDEFGISYSAVSKASGDVERLVGEDRKVAEDVRRMVSRFKG